MTGAPGRVLVLQGAHPDDLLPRFGLSVLARAASAKGSGLGGEAEAQAFHEPGGRWTVFLGALPDGAAPALCAALGTPCVAVDHGGDGRVTFRLFVHGDLLDGFSIDGPGFAPVDRSRAEAVGGGWRAVVVPELLPEFPDGWPDAGDSLVRQLEALARQLGTSVGDLAATPTSPLQETKVLRPPTSSSTPAVAGPAKLPP